MNCHCCNGETKKFGRFQNRNRIVQRYRCVRCGKTMSESQPLDGVRIETQKVNDVVRLLCEGMGIRAVSRFTRLNQETVLNVLETAGQKAAQLLDAKIRNVKAEYVQADELVNFVFSRGQNTAPEDETRGDFFTYLAVDTFSKLVICWRTGKRTARETEAFLDDLKARVPNRFQFTTDAWHVYSGHGGRVYSVFSNSIDYATETKCFGRDNPHASFRVSPRTIVGVRKYRRIGNPYMALATISHCERMNLNVRLFSRRFTRSTLGFSKRLENLKLSNALFIAYFNFCRVHNSLGITPAQAAGLTDHAWTVEELISSRTP